MRVCVIIPVYNEQKEIGQLVSLLKKKDLDVLVVDDGSTDQTAEIARKEGGYVISNKTNQGKGLSLQKGFKFALEQDYEGVITMDGDGQHAVNDAERFLKKAAQTPDCVINGSRMSAAKGMPLIRLLTNKFMSALLSLICRQKIPDTQCGFRYIGRKVLENIRLTSSDFEIESEVLVKASKRGYKVISVPIKTIYRGEVSKIHPFKDTIRFFAYLMREMYSSK